MEYFTRNARNCPKWCVRVFFLVLFAVQATQAQQFSIKRVELIEGKISVHFDLFDTVANRKYTINAYSSIDNFISPLQKVTGDVGTEVRPGPNKKVTWDAPAELGTAFSGKVSIEIRGKLFVPFIRLDDINKTFKRAKDYQITWTGGRTSNIMNFDVYKGDEKITTFANVANAGHYTVNFPQSLKPGTYRFKISDTKNKDEVVYSENFKVKRKVPLLMKAIPVVGLGALITVLAGGSKGEEDIPSPPDPPGG